MLCCAVVGFGISRGWVWYSCCDVLCLQLVGHSYWCWALPALNPGRRMMRDQPAAVLCGPPSCRTAAGAAAAAAQRAIRAPRQRVLRLGHHWLGLLHRVSVCSCWLAPWCELPAALCRRVRPAIGSACRALTRLPSNYRCCLACRVANPEDYKFFIFMNSSVRGPFILEIDMRAIGAFKTAFAGPPTK